MLVYMNPRTILYTWESVSWMSTIPLPCRIKAVGVKH